MNKNMNKILRCLLVLVCSMLSLNKSLKSDKYYINEIEIRVIINTDKLDTEVESEFFLLVNSWPGGDV